MVDAVASIIMRTKDRPVLLPRALESVLRQTYPHWELIIVNDAGAKEPVEAIVKQHKSENQNIRIIHRERSTGMEAASNCGIRASSGKYLVIHDDDDSWDPDFLKESVSYLESIKEADVQGVVAHSTQVNEVISNDSIKITHRQSYNSWLWAVSISSMSMGNLFPPISFLYKREALDAIGSYDETLPVLGDWEFNLRFLLKYNIDVIHKALANYHHRTRLMDGTYSNTVICGSYLHARYDSRIRNRLLRDDLENSRIGIGWFTNSANILKDKQSVTSCDSTEAIQSRLLSDAIVAMRKKGVRNIAVYGAGEIGQVFGKLSLIMGLRINCYIDSNPRLWGAKIDGIEIISLKEAIEKDQDKYFVASFQFFEEIRDTISEAFEETGTSVNIYAPFL